MLNRKEILIIVVVAIILSFVISMMESMQSVKYALISVLIILGINTFAKKIAASYYDSEIEVKLWDIKRYGITGIFTKGYFHPSRKFKIAFPAGAFFPVLFAFFTFGTVKWMASLVFDVKAKVHRTAKRHGLWSFSEMTEYHIGIIAAAGITINLIAAVIGYFINQPEFAKLNIYFAFFNMLPLSDLDGNKIFFGSKVLWSFLAIITLIGMAYALFLI
jgi:Zn-dependent protease